MVTLAVLAVLAAVAIPSFNTLMLNSRIQGRSSALISSANQARLIALRNGVTATLCPGNGTTLVCGTNWSTGWQINAAPTPGAAEQIAAVSAFPPSPTTVTTLGGQNQIAFLPNGIVTNNDAFIVCDARGHTFAMQIAVSASGSTLSSPKQGTVADAVTSIAATAGCP
ncbi:MAG: putative type prepilin [Verrucomicrobiaceae bacterium]|nr:putative type prepilin [Verrucomicrobiaceae bacterium]